MPKKKRGKQTNSSKRSSPHKFELEREIAKNLIELQKVNTNMAEKFEKLAGEISQLLALFEVTARSFTKNMPIGEHEKDKEFLGKIDKLLDQNKTLAKGLTMMEEHLRERMYGHQPTQETRPHPGTSRPPPRF